MWGIGGTAPRILTHVPRGGVLSAPHFGSFILGGRAPCGRWVGRRAGLNLGVDIWRKIFYLPGIEYRFFGRTAGSVVIALTGMIHTEFRINTKTEFCMGGGCSKHVKKQNCL